MAATPKTTKGEQAPIATTAPANRQALHGLIEQLPERALPEAAQLLDELVAGVADEQERALIDRWLQRNPHKPWLDEVQVRGHDVPVWALIGRLEAHGGTADVVQSVAADYELPVDAVQAAVAFYRRHRAVIDARIAANSAEPDDPL